jgi:hypothetical protein
LQNTAATIRLPLTVDGVATDPSPDAATVTITRADGTALVTDAAAADLGTGVFGYTLTPTHTALLDTLTATWTYIRATYEEQVQTTVEVVGGFLFTISEFRALGGGYANTTNYPASAVEDMRTTVEQALEDACDVAFVPRYTRETISGTGGTDVLLRWPKVRAFRSVSIDDADVTSVVALREGLGYLSTGWTFGRGNVVVAYEHGWDTPPMRIRRAALLLAKQWITPGAADDRAINMSNDTGTYALFQAGVRGHTFSIPEVQAAVDAYSMRVGVA